MVKSLSIVENAQYVVENANSLQSVNGIICTAKAEINTANCTKSRIVVMVNYLFKRRKR